MYSVILLAAGISSRMGRLKALLPWNGKTLLEAQIEQVARAPVDELIIVLGFRRERLQAKIIEAVQKLDGLINVVKVIVNEQYYLGKTSSIRAGIKAVSSNSKGVVILAVDQPVNAITLEKLLGGLKEGEIRIPIYEGKKGHPPVFSSRYYEEIRHLTEENEGLRQVIRRHPDCVRYVEAADPQVLFNLNRVQDYVDALEA